MATNLSDQLAQAETQQRTGRRANNVQALLGNDAYKHELGRLLGDETMAERFLRVALTECRRNPELLECTMESFAGALMMSAQLKLEPGGAQGHCWIIPYRDNSRGGKKEAQFQLGYIGLIQLAMRSGQLAGISAHTVCEHDDFDFAYGSEEFIRHRPRLDGDRGKAIAYYATARFANGGRVQHVMSRAEVDKHRKRYSRARTGPWTDPDQFDAMAEKTVIKQLRPFLPASADFVTGLQADESRLAWSAREGLRVDEDTLPDISDTANATAEPSDTNARRHGVEPPTPEQRAAADEAAQRLAAGGESGVQPMAEGAAVGQQGEGFALEGGDGR